MTTPGPGLQPQTLRAFTILSNLRPDWAGALILNLGLNPAGAAVSLAANLAGAVCLTLEPDSALLRTALRTGACDFIVNTLDEALRVMKNEIRKRRSLSVGLEANPAAALDEIAARGVAPQLFTAPATHPQAAAGLRSLGTLTISFEEIDEIKELEEQPLVTLTQAPTAAGILAAFLSTHPWKLHFFAFATPAELRAFEARALSALPAGDALRRRWLLSAARVFPRERRRALWLTGEELAILQTPPA